MKRTLTSAALAACILAGGCRAVFLDGNQDVTIVAPVGETVIVDGVEYAPGPFKLARNKDHVVQTDWGWSTRIESKFAAVEFIAFFLFVDGIFEFIDFADGSAYYLDADLIHVPRRPATVPAQR